MQRAQTEEGFMCDSRESDSLHNAARDTGTRCHWEEADLTKTRNVHMHVTMAFNQDGLPLGVLRCAYGRVSPKTARSIEGLRDVDELSTTLPLSTSVLCMMDRDADAFEILATQRTLKRAHILIRVNHDPMLDTLRGICIQFHT